MKVRYIGKDFGVEGLTNGKIYECVGIEDGMLRVIDDSGEDYLYSAIRPSSLENTELFGRWEIIEDNEKEDLKKIIK
nr:MAG TPA: hypothetical protein [Caudoviricetes sp.]